jgi:hypothetical protein
MLWSAGFDYHRSEIVLIDTNHFLIDSFSLDINLKYSSCTFLKFLHGPMNWMNHASGSISVLLSLFVYTTFAFLLSSGLLFPLTLHSPMLPSSTIWLILLGSAQSIHIFGIWSVQGNYCRLSLKITISNWSQHQIGDQWDRILLPHM